MLDFARKGGGAITFACSFRVAAAFCVMTATAAVAAAAARAASSARNFSLFADSRSTAAAFSALSFRSRALLSLASFASRTFFFASSSGPRTPVMLFLVLADGASAVVDGGRRGCAG